MNLGVKHLIRFNFYLKIGSFKICERDKRVEVSDCRFDKRAKDL